MEAKSKRDRRPSSLAPTIKKTPPRKPGKAVKVDLPNTVAGSEVVGREVSIARTCGNQPVWIAGKITSFDETKVLHQVAYKLPLPDEVKDRGKIAPAEWHSLGNVAFTWLDKPHAFPFANPTFSSQHTPKKEDAIGKRVKVYWSIMGKWYQGIVDAYDNVTGMHRVKFKDGEQRDYKLAHEAFVWLDIPALSSGAAIKKMRLEEGQVPVPDNQSNDENKPPSKAPDSAVNGTLSSRKKSRLGKAEQAPTRKYTRRQHNASQGLPNGGPAKIKQNGKSTHPLSKPDPIKSDDKLLVEIESPSSRPSDPKAEGVNSMHSSSTNKADDVPVAVEVEKPALVSCLETTKSASSSSEKLQSPQAGGCSAAEIMAGKAAPKCVDVKVWTQEERDLPDGARLQLAPPLKDMKRPHPDVTSPKAGADGLGVRSETPRAGKAKLQRPKSAGRSCKNQADFLFVDSCEAIKGSRISVWWESDAQFFKGEVKGYSTCSRTLRVLYDDGYSQKNLSVKNLRFNWLTPRAVSAGATDKLHEAFHHLGADNVTVSPRPSEDRSSVAVEVQVKMEAKSSEGLHPSRPKIEASQPQQSPPSMAVTQQSSQTAVQGLLTSQALQNNRNGACFPTMVPIQAQLPLAGVSAVQVLAPQAFIGSPQHAVFIPTTSPRPVLQSSAPSIHGVLQAASCQAPLQPAVHYPGASQGSSCPQGHNQHTSQTPSPLARSPAAGAAAYRKPQQAANCLPGTQIRTGESAVGWRVSLPFRGDGKMYEGLIIAYRADTGKHRILYKDGEDEWLTLQSELEKLTWIGKCSKGYPTGLPEGHTAPSGKDWDKWRISVYWANDGEFYDGTVQEPDGETADLAQLKVLYDDNEERFENLADMVFKYLEPPPSDEDENEDEDMEDEIDDEGAFAPNQRKRPRSDPDYKSEEEPDCEAPTLFQQPKLQLNLKALNRSSSLRFSQKSSIKRMLSGRGSLLQFSGEDLPLSPVHSPLSPQFSLGMGSLRQDGRGRPVAVRNIDGLRTAEGYRVDVKRVRIFYTPESGPSSQNGSKELPSLPGPVPKRGSPGAVMAAEVPQATAVSAKLKAMLERVEQAKENIRNGMPLEPGACLTSRGYGSLASMPSSRPESAPGMEGQASPQADHKVEDGAWEDLDEEPALKVARSPAGEEAEKGTSILSVEMNDIPEHLTPPSSPFLGTKEPDVCKSPAPAIEGSGPQLPPAILTDTCPGAALVENQTSLSLPQTPSAKFEKVPHGRTEST